MLFVCDRDGVFAVSSLCRYCGNWHDCYCPTLACAPSCIIRLVFREYNVDLFRGRSFANADMALTNRVVLHPSSSPS